MPNFPKVPGTLDGSSDEGWTSIPFFQTLLGSEILGCESKCSVHIKS